LRIRGCREHINLSVTLRRSRGHFRPREPSQVGLGRLVHL